MPRPTSLMSVTTPPRTKSGVCQRSRGNLTEYRGCCLLSTKELNSTILSSLNDDRVSARVMIDFIFNNFFGEDPLLSLLSLQIYLIFFGDIASGHRFFRRA